MKILKKTKVLLYICLKNIIYMYKPKTVVKESVATLLKCYHKKCK